jgi:hypothetical protein
MNTSVSCLQAEGLEILTLVLALVSATSSFSIGDWHCA